MANEGLGSWPRRRARISARDVAIIHAGRSWTYGELADRVDGCAAGLSRAGVGRGDRVAYLGPNHPAFVELLFACGQIGAVFVPLNTRLASAELAFILHDCEATLLVVGAQHRATADELLAGRSSLSLRVIGSDDGRAEPYEALLSCTSEVEHASEVTLDDLAMLMYTSGTTGEAKGVPLTHANLTWNVLNVLIDVDVSTDDVTLVNAPMFHTAALNQTFLPTFLKGGTSLLEEWFDPARTLQLIEQYGVTWMFGVPAMFQALTREDAWGTTDVSSLRAVEAGGAPVPEELIRTFQRRGLTFMQGYGLTEASPGVLFLRAKDSLRKVGSAGSPCFFTDVEVRDDAGAPVEVGATGEVLVRGPNVMSGYWGRPEATARAFTADGWLRTGDVAVPDLDGHLTIVDRMKDMFISGGENVYPAEVEKALHEHPSIEEVAVIGVPDDRWGEVGRAFLVVAEGASVDHAEIERFLAARLARYKVPRSSVVVDALPRNGSGKLLKTRLRD